MRKKSVSPSVVPPTFRRGGIKAFHFLFVLLRFDDLKKKQTVKQSTFPLIVSTNAERTDKVKERNRKLKKKTSQLKSLIGRRATRKKMDSTRICSDKQEALEGSLKTYSKQCLRAELQVIIFMYYDVAHFVQACLLLILYFATWRHIVVKYS